MPSDSAKTSAMMPPTIKSAMRRIAERKDPILRALRLMCEKSAHELRDKPLTALLPLKKAGWVRVAEVYDQHHNGKLWHCQVVKITDSGRDEYQRRISNAE